MMIGGIGEGVKLYYVIQVMSGMEDKVEEQIGIIVEKRLYEGCFHPIRRVKKKIRGGELIVLCDTGCVGNGGQG